MTKLFPGGHWKTPKVAGCYAVTATGDDGSSITAQFELY